MRRASWSCPAITSAWTTTCASGTVRRRNICGRRLELIHEVIADLKAQGGSPAERCEVQGRLPTPRPARRKAMTQELRQINLAFLGFGHVGRAFARLLLHRRAWLHREFGLEWKITGIATQNHGMAIDPQRPARCRRSCASWKRDFEPRPLSRRPGLLLDHRFHPPVRRGCPFRDERVRPQRRTRGNLHPRGACAPVFTW